MTIPASDLVNVTPNVLNAGGAALDLSGLMLTTSNQPPIGTVPSFPTAAAVAAYFGASSPEAAAAAIYFQGFDNSDAKPGALLFAQYPASAVAAYLRGGNIGILPLGSLQAINGTLTVTVDGSSQTGSVNMAGVLSFSSAASVIENALNTATAATGSVAANVAVGRIDPNTGTASITGTSMTVSAILTGAYAPGQTVSGTGVAANTTIVAQLTGTAGSTGTYQVSVSQTVPSTTITSSGGCLNVSAITTGTLFVGQVLSGAGVTASTKITAFLTGTGGTGKYAVDTSQTVAPGTTITGTGGTLTITAVSAGSFGVGDIFSGTNVSSNNTITAILTGTGGIGTYLCSIGDTAGSTAISVAGASVHCTFDSVSGGFVVKSGTTGANSSLTYATGTAATALLLTQASGAVLSPGAAATTPSSFMDGVALLSQSWATFMTIFDPDVAGQNTAKLAFAAWTSLQNNRFAYVAWDTDVSPRNIVPATSSLGYLLKQAAYSGTFPISCPDNTKAAFACGVAASIDFTATEGRTTFAFRSQAGLAPDITDSLAKANLVANGYNCYAAWATSSQSFIGFTPGSVSGLFQWMDSYVNQIQLNAALQQALINLLFNQKSIPYNRDGYTQMESACLDPINAALNFGSIRTGVTLSASQASSVNTAAGTKISNVLATRGWYLQIKDAAPQVRQARKSPPSKFWYMDGQSVQHIDLTSIEVQ